MALAQVNATVGTTAGLIFRLPAGLPYTVITVNNGGANTIHVGALPNVAASGATHGINIASNTGQTFVLNAGDALYAIAGTANAANSCCILYSGI